MSQSIELIVSNKVGLHARPAAQFVRTAAKFASSITVKNTSRCTEKVNAKSILAILSTGVQMGDTILITAEGCDEEASIQALRSLIESDFGEIT